MRLKIVILALIGMAALLADRSFAAPIGCFKCGKGATSSPSPQRTGTQSGHAQPSGRLPPTQHDHTPVPSSFKTLADARSFRFDAPQGPAAPAHRANIKNRLPPGYQHPSTSTQPPPGSPPGNHLRPRAWRFPGFLSSVRSSPSSSRFATPAHSPVHSTPGSPRSGSPTGTHSPSHYGTPPGSPGPIWDKSPSSSPSHSPSRSPPINAGLRLGEASKFSKSTLPKAAKPDAGVYPLARPPGAQRPTTTQHSTAQIPAGIYPLAPPPGHGRPTTGRNPRAGG